MSKTGAILLFAALAVVGIEAAHPVAAQPYPSRAVRLLVGQAPAGAQDIVARLIARELAARLGQPFVVENRPGAGTNIAAATVAQTSPDGYTLLLVGAPNAINASLYERLPFDFLRDIAPVGGFLRSPEVLLVHPSVPATTIGELIRYARANPGALTFASPGSGSGPHLSAAMLAWMAGIQLTHVPYKGGGPALADLLSGQVLANFTAPVVALDPMRTGRVRAIAITSATRSSILPELPTIAEALPGFESGGFFGLGAPRTTPHEVIIVLNRAMNEALADPTLIRRIEDMGGAAMPGSPEGFGQYLAAQTKKWARVVRTSGAKAE